MIDQPRIVLLALGLTAASFALGCLFGYRRGRLAAQAWQDGLARMQAIVIARPDPATVPRKAA